MGIVSTDIGQRDSAKMKDPCVLFILALVFNSAQGVEVHEFVVQHLNKNGLQVMEVRQNIG